MEALKMEKCKVVPLRGKTEGEKYIEELLLRYRNGEVTEFVCIARYSEDKKDEEASYTMHSFWGDTNSSTYLLGLAQRMVGIIERYIHESTTYD